MSYRDPAYFEQLYQRDADPWHFASSTYERDKYAATIAALSGGRFRRAFEVGCSIGVLTRNLADHCDSLLGVDLSETALAQARLRCTNLAHVSLERMTVPGCWPPGTFDLIVFSEVLYYLDPDALDRAARRTLAALSPDGVALLVNWRGETGGACSGDEAAAGFIALTGPGLAPIRQERAAHYRIDVLARRGMQPNGSRMEPGV